MSVSQILLHGCKQTKKHLEGLKIDNREAATKWLKNMTISFWAADILIPIILYAIVSSVSIETMCNVKLQAEFLKSTSPYLRPLGR
jgi:hypothetical protein